MCNIFIPAVTGGDKSVATYDSFAAAARLRPPCLAVISADSFRSVTLFKRRRNYTGFSICRRPDMIQTRRSERGWVWLVEGVSAQRPHKVGDKAQWRGGGRGGGENEGRVMEQLRAEERAASGKRYGLANKRGARRRCKLFAL